MAARAVPLSACGPALVVAEIVAAMVLVVTVGLLTQALLKVQDVHPGFTAENVAHDAHHPAVTEV